MSFIHPHKKEELKKLKVKIAFTGVLPRNISESVATLLEANAGKPIMSQKESVRKSPLTEDPQRTLDELKEEEKRSLAESYEL